jgi:hypothetical protein
MSERRTSSSKSPDKNGTPRSPSHRHHQGDHRRHRLQDSHRHRRLHAAGSAYTSGIQTAPEYHLQMNLLPKALRRHPEAGRERFDNSSVCGADLSRASGLRWFGAAASLAEKFPLGWVHSLSGRKLEFRMHPTVCTNLEPAADLPLPNASTVVCHRRTLPKTATGTLAATAYDRSPTVPGSEYRARRSWSPPPLPCAVSMARRSIRSSGLVSPILYRVKTEMCTSRLATAKSAGSINVTVCRFVSTLQIL